MSSHTQTSSHIHFTKKGLNYIYRGFPVFLVMSFSVWSAWMIYFSPLADPLLFSNPRLLLSPSALAKLDEEPLAKALHQHTLGIPPNNKKNAPKQPIQPKEVTSTPPKNNLQVSDTMERSKYHVLMHVGPHKMSSTTLQMYLEKLAGTSLLADGYAAFTNVTGGCPPYPDYPRRKRTALIAVSLFTASEVDFTCTDPHPVQQFSSFLKESFAEDMNVILSTEELDKPDINLTALYHAIQQSSTPPPRVHVVLYYRRFYEWISSIYYQIHFKPCELGDAYPSFVEWLATPGTLETWLQLYSWAVQERYKKAGFDQVDIVPMRDHEGKFFDVNAHFFCKYVPNAKNTCYEVRTAIKSRENGRQEIESRRILYHAIQKGIIKPKVVENATLLENEMIVFDQTEKIADRWESLEQEDKALFSTCLSPDIQKRLYNLSIRFENKMGCATPGYNIEQAQCPVGVAKVKQDFWANFAAENFCSINTELVLAEKSWQEFLQSI